MAEYIVEKNFQFRGALRATDKMLEVPDQIVVEQVEMGKHEEDSEKWLSGLLNHCTPADDHTRDLVAGKVKPRRSPLEDSEAKAQDEKDKEIASLRGEFDKLGKAYNPRWAVDKLAKELVVARRSAPAQEDKKPKKAVVK